MKNFLLILMIAVLSFTGFSQECSDLIISEYLEGSSQNKALEIYNTTEQTISLDGYEIWRFSNGSASPNNQLDIVLDEGPNEIGPYETIVISNGQIEPNSYGYVDTTLYELADMTGPGVYPTPLYMNGNDAIALIKDGSTPIDLIGVIGQDPGEGWTNIDSLDYQAGDYFWLSWTSQNRLVRKASITQGVTQSPDFFDPSIQWDSIGWDTANIDNNWSHLGYHECDCNPNGIEPTNNPKAQVTMFPNPVAQGKAIRILSNKNIEEVHILNIVGKIVKQEKLINNPGNFVTPTNELNTGIYIVRILFTDNSQKSVRLSVE